MIGGNWIYAASATAQAVYKISTKSRKGGIVCLATTMETKMVEAYDMDRWSNYWIQLESSRLESSSQTKNRAWRRTSWALFQKWPYQHYDLLYLTIGLQVSVLVSVNHQNELNQTINSTWIHQTTHPKLWRIIWYLNGIVWQTPMMLNWSTTVIWLILVSWTRNIRGNIGFTLGLGHLVHLI